ncbi:GntR family transcriptional regulator [Tsukamurella sp. 8J]|nr:GntR family transcriptional regulator [Tsukamurella sp. 8J]MDF0528493.1 GntR family transcriptional regulator [Tsukamurella sp. 8J]
MARMIEDNSVPKHEQLRHLLERLCADELGPGDMLPSERQLCLDYGVSRITVREAIGQMVAAGRLVRIRGKGTFVAERQARSRLHLASFHEDMRRLGRTPTTVVLQTEHKVPGPSTLSALGLRAAEKAWHVKRLRLADSQPISIDDAWYSAALAPGLDRYDLSQSIYQLLKVRYHRPIDHGEQTIGAEAADREQSTLLQVAKGAPLLAFDRVSFTADGTPIEHCRSWYRSDMYQVQMTVTDPA